jgi:hypothetical protein
VRKKAERGGKKTRPAERKKGERKRKRKKEEK